MTAPIIAAVDPFNLDRAPLDLACAAAAATGARLIAAAVYPWSMSGESRKLDELRDYLGIETRVLTDVSPPRAVHGLADDLGAELIVVGSSTRGAIGRVLTGTTAERVVHGSPCPVVLAPRGYTAAPIKTIAAGFVDTPDGHAALAAAHSLAASFGARLRVVAALHSSRELEVALGPGPRPQRGAMLEGRLRNEVESAMEHAVTALEPGVDIETELHVDDPADILVAVSGKVDLLVCGSRGYGPLRSVLLGGVSHRLMRGAQCPVLVLPRGAERGLEDLLPLATASIAR